MSRQTLLKQERKIRKLDSRVTELEGLASRIRPEGTIKGYYLAEDGKVEEVKKHEEN